MQPKQLVFHDAAREKIRRGVDALAEAVKVTPGPRGRTVILERDFGPPQIVNSGVLVANMGAQLLREVAGGVALIKVGAAVEEGIVPGILNRVDESPDQSYGYNAASIASLILTTDCMIATAPKQSSDEGALSPEGSPPMF